MKKTRYDDELDLDGYRPAADARIWIPVAVVLILLVIVIGALIALGRGKHMEEPAVLSEELDTEQTKEAEDTQIIAERTEDQTELTEGEANPAKAETELTEEEANPVKAETELTEGETNLTESQDSQSVTAGVTSGQEGASVDAAPETAVEGTGVRMNFTEVNETVTAKERTNLRDIPSQDTDSVVKATIANGETAVRTGISDSGWSRLEIDGQTFYAVSSYLTTDLNYRPAEEDTNGLKTKFTATGDTVTAKIEVNLRMLPSVTNPDAVVVAVLHNGETVTRTGINNEYGWSRVDYNGQTLYCISSYLTTVE